MAEVFLAKMEGIEGFERRLAIKRILPHYSKNDSFVRMFIDEARLVGHFTHPNIVQTYDFGKINDCYYISMEYVDGINVADILTRYKAEKKSVPIEVILEIGLQACRGIDYAHKETDQDGKPLGIIHRDLTPHNILVSRKGVIKITDFGIAKASMNTHMTQAGMIKGKVPYMSPEQAMGIPLTPVSDIFSFGIVMYEMCTLRRLFEGENDFTILKKVQDAKIPSIREQNKTIPEELEQIILKALSRDREKRYQSASEMEMDLTRLKFSYGSLFRNFSLTDFVNDFIATRVVQKPAPKPAGEKGPEVNESLEAIAQGISEVDDPWRLASSGSPSSSSRIGEADGGKVTVMLNINPAAVGVSASGELKMPMDIGEGTPSLVPKPRDEREGLEDDVPPGSDLLEMPPMSQDRALDMTVQPPASGTDEPLLEIPSGSVEMPMMLSSDLDGMDSAQQPESDTTLDLAPPIDLSALPGGFATELMLEIPQTSSYSDFDQPTGVGAILIGEKNEDVAKKPTGKKRRWVGGVVVAAAAALAAMVALWMTMPRTGSITVEVMPEDAEIFVNGQKVASSSPWLVENLPADQAVDISIRKEGFKEFFESRTIKAGARDRLPVMLEVEPRYGFLILESTPAGARVLLKGNQTGWITPCRLNLAPGTAYDLKFELDGFAPRDGTYTVREGEEQKIRIDFQQQPEPASADRNGTPSTVTPSGTEGSRVPGLPQNATGVLTPAEQTLSRTRNSAG